MVNIKRILEQTEYENQFPESEFLLALGNLEERLGVQYGPTQKEAIQTALMSPMMILTGGPGRVKRRSLKESLSYMLNCMAVLWIRKIIKKKNPIRFCLRPQQVVRQKG